MTNWHILGAGSMGCLWAGLLRSRGLPVTLILKDESALGTYQDAGGVQVERNGKTSIFNCEASVATSLPLGPPTDAPPVLIITTKAYDTVSAMLSLGDRLHHYGTIILMQNGMGTLEQIEATLPGLPLYIGITAQGAYRTAPFQIVHAGEGPTWIGSLAPGLGPDSNPIRDLLALQTGMAWDRNILLRMWRKLAVNCVINGLTVILDCSNGDIASEDQLPLVQCLCSEIEKVMSSSLPPPHDFQLFEEVIRVAHATSRNISSMLQDVRRGRHTEIDYINGYLVGAAEKLQVAVPENNQLFEELRAAVIPRQGETP